MLVAAMVAVAACSPGGDDDVTGDRSVRSSDPATTTVAAADEPAATSEPVVPGTLPGPDDLPLPGLLDSTDEVLPDDPAVRTGELANGLRYYVRENDNPGAKAELRLAIDAGSADETGPATGVAHFVEHMLFNGTEQFPENELIDTLRSFGAAFGADVNASTGYDATVYELSVPNDDETVELGLTVLEQWLSHATIDETQVLAERGVVLDEWRTRTQTTSGRLFAAAEPMFLAGTPYAGRSPIGDRDSIAEMSVDELRSYYDAHYRPDNAAVVVVGDIDVDEVEADIERLFGPAVARTDEAPGAIDGSFPPDLSPDALVHTDPDQQTVDVEITFPLGVEPPASTAEVRAVVLDALALEALLRRLDEDITAGRAPFDEIARGTNSYVSTLDAPGLYAITDADRMPDTLQALLDELERARRFGFRQDELDVARDALRAAVRSRYDGRDSTQDRDFAADYVDAFLDGVGYPSIEDEFAALTDILDGITTEALDLRYRTRLANTAPHVIVAAPASVADRLPSESTILDTVAATVERELEPRGARRALPDRLMDPPDPVDPADSSDVLPRGDDLFDPLRLEFPNGVTVVLNGNDIVEGQVFLEGASRGGLSLVADDDVVDALYASEIVLSSGLADFDASDLDVLLAAVDVSLDAWLMPYSEHVAGTVATTDLEVLFQLLHLALTEPRADEVALRQVVNRYGPVVADPAADPDLAATDALLDARYPDELRYAVLPTPEEFETLDLEGVRRVWSERFQRVDDWVFVLSGDLDVEVAADLASRYLGTLPGAATESPVDVGIPPPAGVVRVPVTAGTGDTGLVLLSSTAPVDDITAELTVAAEVATELLAARLVDVIREELGDSYSPFVLSSVALDPDPVVETVTYVSAAPDRVATVADLVAAEIRDLVEQGASDQEYVNAFAQVQERYRFVDNGQFVTALLRSELEPAWELDDYLFRSDALAGLEPADVQAFLTRYVPVDQYIEVTVTPR